MKLNECQKNRYFEIKNYKRFLNSTRQSFGVFLDNLDFMVSTNTAGIFKTLLGSSAWAVAFQNT